MSSLENIPYIIIRVDHRSWPPDSVTLVNPNMLKLWSHSYNFSDFSFCPKTSFNPRATKLGIFTHLDFVSVVTKQGLINEYRPWNVDKLGLCEFEENWSTSGDRNCHDKVELCVTNGCTFCERLRAFQGIYVSSTDIWAPSLWDVALRNRIWGYFETPYFAGTSAGRKRGEFIWKHKADINLEFGMVWGHPRPQM